jgi:hypothetical protein
MDQDWVFTEEELACATASRSDGMNEKEEEWLRRKTALYVKHLSSMLQL